MIDNFDNPVIRKILDSGTEDTFMSIMVLKRKKDIPDLHRNSVLVRTFWAHSWEELQMLKPKIEQACVLNNARAYIDPTLKSVRKSAFQMLKLLADYIESQQYEGIFALFDKVAGRGSGYADGKKVWVIDCDTQEDTDRVVKWLWDNIAEGLLPEDTWIGTIPTPHGTHFLVKPFNPKEFGETFPGVEIKKSNPTILYVPGLEALD